MGVEEGGARFSDSGSAVMGDGVEDGSPVLAVDGVSGTGAVRPFHFLEWETWVK